MLTLFSHRLIPNSQFNDKMTCEATTKEKTEINKRVTKFLNKFIFFKLLAAQVFLEQKKNLLQMAKSIFFL